MSWVSKTRMEKMLSASGALTANFQWGEDSEEGGMLLAQRRYCSGHIAGFPIAVRHEGGSSSSVQRLTATGLLRGWREGVGLLPKPSIPAPPPSNFTVTVLGEAGWGLSLCMTIGTAAMNLGALLRQELHIWTEPFIFPHKTEIIYSFSTFKKNC